MIYRTFFERIAHQSRGEGRKFGDEDFGARVTHLLSKSPAVRRVNDDGDEQYCAWNTVSKDTTPQA